ncbi:nuclear transport factor 2 family protein [Burkholderia stabilis]|uniref:nuclear transport factor 2 family protein n=1 Tax=Burkholderia stabilis TaxID=95485 RepID=UPI001F4A7976|nr:nuclear transport factor 2 family protein [Burkholderia stabilis]
MSHRIKKFAVHPTIAARPGASSMKWNCILASRMLGVAALVAVYHAAAAQGAPDTFDSRRAASLSNASDVIAVERALAQYVSILDAGVPGESQASRVARFTRLFDADGIWTEHVWNGGKPDYNNPVCVVRGRTQLTRFATLLFGTNPSGSGGTVRHNLVSPLIDINGDRAQAAVNLIQTRDAFPTDGRADVIATGRYYLSFRRQESGWAIVKLDLMADHQLNPPCTPSGPL